MQKLKNFVFNQWVEGTGDGTTLYNAVNGDPIALVDTSGIAFSQVIDFGRTVGYGNISKLSFYQRGEILKNIALFLLERKQKYYDLSYQTGATHSDSWVDIEGGLGTFFTYSGLAKRHLPNTPFWVDPETQKLSTNGSFIGTHLLTPSEGVSVQINAFNFPCWGMLEKLSTSLLAGVPAIVKPATPTSYLTHAMFEDIIASNLLPEGALQLICGSAGNLLDYVSDGDSVVFTGSASTGKKLKSMDAVKNNSVRFNMEADSLNCSILGLDAKKGSPEFDLFIKEVVREMTTKAGQKCTAIRRIIVPELLLEEVQTSLSSALDKVVIGNPLNREVRMGSLAGQDQLKEFQEKYQLLASQNQTVYNGDHQLIDAHYEKGAFVSPKLMLCEKPLSNNIAHDVEAFGPISTLMPYRETEEAIALAKRGKGSLVGSIVSNDADFVSKTAWGMASSHGRIFVLNRESAKESTGHGSPLPSLMHGGPGRAGGGEEMGGLHGLQFYLQKTAIQGSPNMVQAMTQIYQSGADKRFSDKHPFQNYFEQIEVGQSVETATRTVTDADIVNFSNVSWDHFYAHTDSTSLNGTIFDKKVAHGYFILSAAAGLFVSAKKGPVIANYGLENCSFMQPVYAGDSITVYLTAKEKINRGVKGHNIPSGVVKWLVEVVNQREEVVCVATILTLVAKKSPFINIKHQQVAKILQNLSHKSTAQWGIMTPQNMLEHLENSLLMSIGEIAVTAPQTNEKLEKLQDSLYQWRAMPQNFKFPLLPENENAVLRHKNLDKAKESFLESLKKYRIYYRENPMAEHANAVFGMLNNEMWELLHQKHFQHHFTQFGLI